MRSDKSAAAMGVRSVIAEDSLLMREGITSALAPDEDIARLATCGDYDELLSAVEGHQPDVVETELERLQIMRDGKKPKIRRL